MQKMPYIFQPSNGAGNPAETYSHELEGQGLFPNFPLTDDSHKLLF